MSPGKSLVGFSLSAFVLCWSYAAAAENRPYSPPLASASNEAEQAIQRFQLESGFKAEVFASEPSLANPIAFHIDEKGRYYVIETFRLFEGVTDNRSHMYWLEDDLASRTVADRVAMYKKHFKDKVDEFGREHDRLRIIEDRNGDGKADFDAVYADGFSGLAEGLAAGVLARNGDVWFTNIPHLWKLRDNNGDGKADVRESLSEGYGVHVAYLGHDMHGLRFGPDGKLYFSIGDRGFSVKTKEGKLLDYPDTGAVLRCNADGTDLEVFASGMRNPQELAFDDHGNLFTGDNNSDGGDQARWVYVVEGGDCGWRIGYQYHSRPTSRGPWRAEDLWKPRFPDQAAYINPPLANITNGPSGLTYYPGTGMPVRYNQHFFLCDFKGEPSVSGVWSLANKPKGAGFEMIDHHHFAWHILSTDCEFGVDGGLYVLDWVQGWRKTGKGRIYKIFDPVAIQDPLVAQVKKLLAEGFNHRPLTELGELLAHRDQRIRQEAQFALAAKGADGVAVLTAAALSSPAPLARLHGIWGLGQIGRTSPKALDRLPGLLDDKDPEVRAQAAKVLGEGKYSAAAMPLIEKLRDDSPRVRYFAALALGKIGDKNAIGPLVELLRTNADDDLFLRHAAVMGLTWIGDKSALLAFARDSSAAVRLGIVLVLRRLESPEIASFLDDSEPRVVLEAARAIHDVPIESAFPQLAGQIDRKGLSDMLLSRVLNANYRLGGADRANNLAKLAADKSVSPMMRVDALEELLDWTNDTPRDRVTGAFRPLPGRPAEHAAVAVRDVLPAILREAPDEARRVAAELAGKYAIAGAAPELHVAVRDLKASGETRSSALGSLALLKDAKLDEAVKIAVSDKDLDLRLAGLKLMATTQPDEAVAIAKSMAEKGKIAEKQLAFDILGNTPGSAADSVIGEWMDRMVEQKSPPEVQLDILEAAGKRTSEAIRDRVTKFEASRASGDHLAHYRETLVGGDRKAGHEIFYNKVAVSCLRCHKVDGRGGQVGPDLSGIGIEKNREYLLEAVVHPSKQIAKGFDSVVLATSDGTLVSGLLREETEKELRLLSPEGKLIIVDKSDIEDRQPGKSSMPDDMTKHLSKAELRDLIEYLASLKNPVKKIGGHE